MTAKTLVQDRLFRGTNNFDFLRFAAATMVLLGHSYHLLLLYSQEPLTRLTGILDFGGLGVWIFFVISGYLVSASLHRLGSDYRNYLRNRILRLFPALFVAVVFAALVIGPIFTRLRLADYLRSASLWTYFGNAVLLIQLQLPGVFLHNLFVGVVNGSLWTLPVEFCMYITLLFLGIIGIFRKRLICVFTLSLLVFLIILFPSLLPRTPPFTEETPKIILLVIYFLSGNLLYVYKNLIPLDSRILFVLLLSWIISFHTPYCEYISLIFIPYAVIWFALGPVKVTRNFARYGDFSYGMYLYAFPIQQSFIQIGLRSPVLLFVSAFALTLPIAIVSWHFIELPALKLKHSSSRARVSPCNQ